MHYKVGAQIVSFADDRISSVEGFTVNTPEKIKSEDFDALLVSPGWREDHPLIRLAKSEGKAILNEVDLAWAIKNEINPAKNGWHLLARMARQQQLRWSHTSLQQRG
jgi:UDP-N-acetylmuramoylalanine--D-glutamate ligase